MDLAAHAIDWEEIRLGCRSLRRRKHLVLSFASLFLFPSQERKQRLVIKVEQGIRLFKADAKVSAVGLLRMVQGDTIRSQEDSLNT